MGSLAGVAYPMIRPSEIRTDGAIAFDFENDEDDYTPVLLSFAWREGEEIKSVVYDCNRMDNRLKNEVFDLLRRARKLVAHNIKHEMIVLRYWGFDTRQIESKIEDTMIIQHCVNTEAEKGLKVLAKKYLGMDMVEYKVASKLGRTAFIEYNREDSIACLKLFEHMQNWTRDWDVNTVYELELAVVPWLVDAFMHGVSIDTQLLDDLNKEIEQTLMTYEARMIDIAGGMINLNSSKQLVELLYDQWKLPVNNMFVTGKGQPGTTGEALEWLVEYGDLKPEQSEFITTLLDYKKQKKLKDAFVGPNFLKRVHADGKFRTNLSSIMTKTGRESSSEPNLQNIPSKPPGNIVRKAFVASPGNKLIVCDYSQIEYRLFAHFSGSKELIEAYKNGSDFHQAIADLLHVPRPLAKTINFALFYGAGIEKFTRLVNRELRKSGSSILDYKTAEKHHSTYTKNPSRKKLLEACLRYAKANNYIRTLSGRIRRFDGYRNMNESTLGRYALSTTIQGSAADLMKLAKVRLRKVLPSEVKAVLSVHDELIFDCPEDMVDEIMPVVQHEMENVHNFALPLVAEPNCGNSWYEAK